MCLNNDRKDKKFKSEEIIKVKYTIYAVAKGKHEKIQACQDSNPDLCNTGAAL